MAASALARRSALRSPDERLSETVLHLTRGWMRLGREAARGLGLSLPQLFLLSGLREMGKVPVTRWVEVMGSSPSACTGLIDGMESEGYILRTRDDVDRRQVLISLTPKGRHVADRVNEELRQKWKTFCANIPRAQLGAASATLERIQSRIGPVEEPVAYIARITEHRRKAP
jgi:DNA-binding MarR family transcriptional regulator